MKDLVNHENKLARIRRHAKACKRNMLNKPIVMLKTNSRGELVWK